MTGLPRCPVVDTGGGVRLAVCLIAGEVQGVGGMILGRRLERAADTPCSFMAHAKGS